MPSVKIGPEFFAKARKDYSNWIWAWVREILQNSLDAPGTSAITVHVLVLPSGNTQVLVRNDGEPMSEQVLTDKLLSLGSSGKDHANGSVGGFGKAKELLYFSALSWGIRSGELVAEGVGGQYELVHLEHDPLQGTESLVEFQGDLSAKFCDQFKKFASLAQRPEVTLTLNGVELPMNLKKGTPRREFDFGKVYSNRQHEHLVVVRIGGMPMFSAWCGFKGCVVVELEGASDQVLTANRDGLLYDPRQEFEAFLTQLAVDKRSALRQRKAEIKRYAGERLRNEAKQPRAVGSLLELVHQELTTEEDGRVQQTLAAFISGGKASSGIATEVTDRQESRVSIGPEFLLQNTTGMQTPEYYVPGPLFSDYSLKLALAWSRCLLELHRILDLAGEFSIGFVLDEDCAALSSKSPEYGQVYYVNPATLVSQQDRSQCRSFKRRFTGAWQDRYELLSLAVHELVHGAYGHSCHDEDYSSCLTEVTAKIFPHISKLSALFRA